LDHDDHKLKFENVEETYKKTLTRSNDIYKDFLTVRAKDDDCTNNGFACSYELISDNTRLPFTINNNGQLSSTQPLQVLQTYKFIVRAFDCVNKESFVETNVNIDIAEPCIPQWIDFKTNLKAVDEYTTPFNSISLTACDQMRQDINYLSDSTCQIDGVNSVVKLVVGKEIQNTCSEKCKKGTTNNNNQIITPKTNEKIVIFNAASDDDLESSRIIENDDINSEYLNSNEEEERDDENSVLKSSDIILDRQKRGPLELSPPLNYRSFNRKVENAQKFNGIFDGQLGDKFTLSSWVKRPAQADTNIKEHIFCGTDSSAMNRHHFGLYFYRGNIKLLVRREAKTSETHSVFYPSLWEWKLSDSILKDQKWHFYEIKFNYPNATLFIDGVQFLEDNSNNDIIDAYELKNMNELTGQITTYIGACYHARANLLTDHFEGDISSIILTKGDTESVRKEGNEIADLKDPFDCTLECQEVLEMNLIGNENYIQSIENSKHDELSVQTNNVYDMTQILRKINYVNKNADIQQYGMRKLILSTTIHCSNSDKTIKLNEITMKVDVIRTQQEYNVQLDGNTQIYDSRKNLESGIEVFKHFAIYKIEINKIDDSSNNKGDINFELEQEQKLTKLSQCVVRIEPKRNLLAPNENNEKLMFLQNLLDEFNFKFEETLDQVTISGVQTTDNYERFIRRLSYVITNIPENHETFKLNKRFYLSCVRHEPNIETNEILVRLNITGEQKTDYVARKQLNQFFAPDADDDVLKQRSPVSSRSSAASSMTPAVIGLIAMVVCAFGFIVLFVTVRLNKAGFFGNNGRRRQVPNEENPEQMEWDDSSLNITENPLDTFSVRIN
jgi:hypothetical protein